MAIIKVLLTVEQAAGRLQITPYTVRRWISEGKLHAVRPGRTWRIPKESLGNLLKSNAIQTSPLSNALEMARKRDARQSKLIKPSPPPMIWKPYAMSDTLT